MKFCLVRLCVRLSEYVPWYVRVSAFKQMIWVVSLGFGLYLSFVSLKNIQYTILLNHNSLSLSDVCKISLWQIYYSCFKEQTKTLLQIMPLIIITFNNIIWMYVECWAYLLWTKSIYFEIKREILSPWTWPKWALNSRSRQITQK